VDKSQLILAKCTGGRGAVMGGPGSGSWYRWDSKTTVEESLSLGIGSFRDCLFSGASGRLTWTRGDRCAGSVGYCVDMGPDGPALTLHYRWRDEEDIRLPTYLQATRPALGGRRWWFTCPLVVAGVPCNRRVGRLYLPPGARYFGCRHCHRLVYRSSQEAHQAERALAVLGVDPEVARLLASRMGR